MTRSAPLGLLVISLDVPIEFDEEFNDWYDTEHIPERLRVAGFLGARRYVRSTRPRYRNVYDLRSLDVLESPEYLAISGKNKSPWTTRVFTKIKSAGGRRLYTRMLPNDDQQTEDHAIAIFRTLPETTDRGVLEAYLAGLREEAPSKDGVMARAYEGHEQAAGEYLLCVTASDADARLPPSPPELACTEDRFDRYVRGTRSA